VHQDELRKLLTDFAAERLALLQRHEAAARVVSHYDFNNTYQYIISREETHLTWLENALREMELPMPQPQATAAVPPPPKVKKVDASTFRAILGEDAKGLNAFVERWRPQVATMTHARHRTMLDVVLGESMEHSRLFAQASAGFEDVLGRRTAGAARVGAVLPTRWQE
jgi:Mn-containing catalase